MEELIAEIAYHDFGQTARDIIKCLQTHGACTVSEICQFTSYQEFDIKNMLVVLLKHACLSIKSQSMEESAEQREMHEFLYEINRFQLYSRVRFPKVLTHPLQLDSDTITQSQARQILEKVILEGSVADSQELEPLIAAGYLAKADFDIQMATQEEEVKMPNKDGEGEHGSSYYTLNMRKFVHELRNEDLKKLVATKLGTECGLIMGVFLDNSKLMEKSEVFENSEMMSVSEVMGRLKKMEGVPETLLTEASLTHHLDLLQNDSLEALKKVKVDVHSGEAFYSAQVWTMVKTLQLRCIERIIEGADGSEEDADPSKSAPPSFDRFQSSYGRFHKRVFSILLKTGFLDENEIVKLCFMPPRDVRKIINSLFQEGIIETQEVPNKAGNMVVLYSTDFDKVKLKILKKIQKSLLNVKLRLEDMRQKLNEKLTAWTHDQEAAYLSAIAKLEYVQSHLDNAIMIFTEY